MISLKLSLVDKQITAYNVRMLNLGNVALRISSLNATVVLIGEQDLSS